jgi:hypothetical protein
VCILLVFRFSWNESGGKVEVQVVYYSVIKRELNRRPIYECRCDERLKDKDERSTLLENTGLYGGLEHLNIETRLINERFASVMGDFDRKQVFFSFLLVPFFLFVPSSFSRTF